MVIICKIQIKDGDGQKSGIKKKYRFAESTETYLDQSAIPSGPSFPWHYSIQINKTFESWAIQVIYTKEKIDTLFKENVTSENSGQKMH